MRILGRLLREIPKWDTASQIAILLAVILLIIDLLVLATISELKTSALVGALGIILAIQAIFMWGNRNLVEPYTQAQRLFIQGDFEGTVHVLKNYIEQEAKPNIDALVLLGNAYRNLGQLRESESVLRIALARNPKYHFALYGVGKIRLAKGDYLEAIKHFEEALNNNAPEIVRFDLAHALLRAGKEDDALRMFQQLPELSDPHRILLAQYVLFVVGGERPTQHMIELGLPFWEAEVERFNDTPYGQAVVHDVEAMKQLL